ncbi:MAG: CAP domain-containing protein [Pseudomonadota bacterium]|uniref:CAP domain-containing protein n=1 Tax=Polaromonas sp. TaxID=1869339 RepID=UPI0017E37E7E|nr:CAP domain-containing protein [Polaromonas sp.]MBA3594468.1 CAP domain-containing protein [Polaromonas sp.]MDQ3271697.1 CAP domain-containing protein [Pseudomonadota bacterium]
MNFKHGIFTHLRPRQLATVFGVFSLLAPGLPLQAQTPPPDNPTLLRAINAVRDQGCGSGPASSPALRESAALSRAAVMISGGAQLDDAIHAAGYRPARAAQLIVGGISGADALAPRVLGKSCPAVMPPHFLEAGFHQRGSLTWVVLAEPFVAPQASEGQQIEARILELVNTARAKPRRCGDQPFPAVPPLMSHTLLTGLAASHAADMARHNYFSHTARDGSTVDVRATRAGYRWRNIGENIAAGQLTADHAVQAWLDSPGHCANVMAPNFEAMGAAFAVNPQTKPGVYWAQVFGSGR